MTINIIIIAVIIALLPALYLFGAAEGLLLGLCNVGIIIGLLYWYRFIENLKLLGAIAITCLTLIVILYMILGAFWGRISLVGIDISVFVVITIGKAAQSTPQRSRRSTYPQRAVRRSHREELDEEEYEDERRGWRSPSNARRFTADDLIGPRRTADELIGKPNPKKLEYFGKPKSYENLVGKRKKRRYF